MSKWKVARQRPALWVLLEEDTKKKSPRRYFSCGTAGRSVPDGNFSAESQFGEPKRAHTHAVAGNRVSSGSNVDVVASLRVGSGSAVISKAFCYYAGRFKNHTTPAFAETIWIFFCFSQKTPDSFGSELFRCLFSFSTIDCTRIDDVRRPINTSRRSHREIHEMRCDVMRRDGSTRRWPQARFQKHTSIANNLVHAVKLTWAFTRSVHPFSLKHFLPLTNEWFHLSRIRCFLARLGARS